MPPMKSSSGRWSRSTASPAWTTAPTTSCFTPSASAFSTSAAKCAGSIMAGHLNLSEALHGCVACNGDMPYDFLSHPVRERSPGDLTEKQEVAHGSNEREPRYPEFASVVGSIGTVHDASKAGDLFGGDCQEHIWLLVY